MDETILSLQAMQNIYKMVTQNLKTARARMEKEATKFPKRVKMEDLIMLKRQDMTPMEKEATKFPTRVKTEDLIMLKRHDKKAFEPIYEGYYHILKRRGNQVDVQSVSGGQVKTVHIKDIKVVLPVDQVINEIPDYTNFGRKSKLDLDPNKIPDLNWILSTRIHMHTTPTTTVSVPSQTVVITLSKMPMMSTAISANIPNNFIKTINSFELYLRKTKIRR